MKYITIKQRAEIYVRTENEFNKNYMGVDLDEHDKFVKHNAYYNGFLDACNEMAKRLESCMNVYDMIEKLREIKR